MNEFTIDKMLDPAWVVRVVDGGGAEGDKLLRQKAALFVAVYSEHFVLTTLAEGIHYPANPSLTVNLAVMLEAMSGSRDGSLAAIKADTKVSALELVQMFLANPVLTFIALASLTRSKP